MTLALSQKGIKRMYPSKLHFAYFLKIRIDNYTILI